MITESTPQAQIDAILWARSVLDDPRMRVIDTETTGTDRDDEIVDIAIVDREGQTLLNSLVRPRKQIPATAARIHGIGNRDVRNAPRWDDLYTMIRRHLGTGGPIVIYNAEFDSRLIEQSNRINKQPSMEYDWHCAMLAFARFRGEWNYAKADYRWAKLSDAVRAMGIEPDPNAHQALADTLMTLDLIRAMADTRLPGETHGFRQQSFLIPDKPSEPPAPDPDAILSSTSDLVLEAVADRLRAGEPIGQIIRRIRGNQ